MANEFKLKRWGLLLAFILLSGTVHSADEVDTVSSGINVEDFKRHTEDGPKWQNNPFIHPLGDYKMEEFVLMAIVYHPQDKAALINGEILREGELLGESEVVRIERKYVVLRNVAGIFRLNLAKIGDKK